MMSFRTRFFSIPLLWRCTTALPALGSWPNGTSSARPTYDIHTAAAYSLIDTYDSSNWLNRFDVQDISDPTRRSRGRRLTLALTDFSL